MLLESDEDSEDDFEFINREYVDSAYHNVAGMFEQAEIEAEGPKYGPCPTLPCTFLDYAAGREVALKIALDSSSCLRIMLETMESGMPGPWRRTTTYVIPVASRSGWLAGQHCYSASRAQKEPSVYHYW